MKREFIALAVILAILAGAIVNEHYVERKTKEFSQELQTAQELYEQGAAEKAVSKVSDSLDNWLQWKRYAHIMLRHSEVDNVTEAYYDLLAAVEDKDESVSSAEFGKVRQLLQNISDMEQISIGAIL
ncbi:MAG: DUF4363 family protein [Oscillospiraceae bacterium]|jgi:hypothetical protein